MSIPPYRNARIFASLFVHSDETKVTEHQITLTRLAPGQTYTFVVSSTDLAGNTVSSEVAKLGEKTAPESGFTTDTDPDTAAPLLVSGPEVISITDTMATIRWTTDEIADSRVEYGLQGQALSGFSGDVTLATEHMVTLTNLTPSTAYDFRASSVDVAMNGPASSSTLSFTTAALPDTAAPVFNPAPSASGITDSAAFLTWGTDELSTSQVLFGRPAGNLTSVASVAGLAMSHQVALTNLSPGTTYYYVAVSSDQSGNRGTSSTGQFVTLGTSVDTDGDGWDDASDAFPNRTGEWADADGDGLGDNFERTIVDANPSDDMATILDVLPGDNFDGDERNNGQEFAEGTDPTNPADFVGMPLFNGVLGGLLALALMIAASIRLRSSRQSR